MQLRRVRVRHIRSYEAGEVSFPPGTTLIAGDVGAGKTSLLYAIEMALFGAAEVDAAYLVRHGAPHAEVEVEFEGDGHVYRIRRRFRRVHRRGRESFEPERTSFAVDGAETAYSATELRQRVIELLGFPDNPNPHAHSDLWRWAVYVPQERMRDILAARPQERLETVRKALGVERYRTAADNAQELAADLRRSAQAVRGEADRLQHHDRDHAEWTAEADRLHGDRSRLTETIATRERSVAEARTARADAESVVRELEGRRALLESLRREDHADEVALREADRTLNDRRAEAERRRTEAETARRDVPNLDALRGARTAAVAERDLARSRLDDLERPLRELAEATADAAAAEERLEEARRSLARAGAETARCREQRDAVHADGPVREPRPPTPSSLAELDELLTAARSAETRAQRDLALAQRSLAELDELLAAGVCPQCGQAVRAADFESHRLEAQGALETREESDRLRAGERAALEEARRARERFERAHERWTEVEKRRAMADAAVSAAESDERSAGDSLAKAEAGAIRTRERVRSLAGAEAAEPVARRAMDEAERRLSDLTAAFDGAVHAAERLRAAEAAGAEIVAEIQRRDRERVIVFARWEERRLGIVELEQALGAADARLRALSEADRILATAESDLANERQLLVRVDTRLDEAARRIAEAVRGRTERTERLREADDLAGKAAWISGPFRTAVLAMEQQLLAHAQDAFERRFARYFSSLVDDPSLLARTDVAFTPAVTIEGEWTPAEALSGGERTSLALAFRLALAHVVRTLGGLHLETILLDEPTDGFSPEQVVRMGELLEEIALPQVVIVSHEGELAAIADRVVRVEKRDGRSTVRGAEGSPADAPTTGPAPPASLAARAPGKPGRRRPT